MKKIIVALLAFAMVFAFTSCESEPSLKEMTVGVRLGQHVKGESEDGSNWKSAVLSMEGDVVTIQADLDAMKNYQSSVSSQGEAKWLALLIDTGISDLANVVYNGEALGDAGANEYKDLKGVDVDGTTGKATEMVLWIKAEDTQYTSGRTITLSYDGYVEKEITIKVENVKLVTVRTPDDFTTAIAGDKKVVLSNDITLAAEVDFTKSVDIDLNGKTLSTDLDLNINENATSESPVVDVTISNGKLVLNSNVGTTHGTLRLYTNSNVTLDNVEYTTNATGIFFKQSNANAKAVIKDSKITSTGSYAIGTNASKEESENMIVEIENSTISAAEEGATGILFNVNGGVTIKNSTVIGGKQAMIARGGTHSFTDTTFEAKYALTESGDEYLEKDWATGNGVPVAALVVGNRNSGESYPYGTTVTLDGVTFTAPGNVYGIYVYQNKPEEAVSVKGTVTALPTVNETSTMNGATYEVTVK